MSPPRFLVPLALAAAALVAVPGLAMAQRMSIVYDTQACGADAHGSVRAGPGDRRRSRGLPPGSRIGGLFDPPGATRPTGSARSARRCCATLSPEGIADRLQDEIDDPEYGNTSGLVAVDEIGNTFNDGRVKVSYSIKTVRGRRIRVSSFNRLIVTKTGWRLAKGPVPLPVIAPDSPGAKLSDAMALLAARPYPRGGSYAERVHFYVAPAFLTSLADGRGPHHHLGRDGQPHRATWRGVMPALSRAGGVWLEMYHHSSASGLTSLSATEWRKAPKTFLTYGGTFGIDPTRIHVVFSSASQTPAGASGCGSPMECQWALAASTPAGAQILANGPGAYSLGSQAREWRMAFNRVFAGRVAPAVSSTVPNGASWGSPEPAREACGRITDHGHRAAGGHRQASASGSPPRRPGARPGRALGGTPTSR